jgi:endonuclease/exonuclease/phosphatase family metal-dependent hydrolase
MPARLPLLLVPLLATVLAVVTTGETPAALAPVAPSAAPVGPTAAPPARPLRLMSYNILHSLNPLPWKNWSSRRPLVWHVIRTHDPDVLAMQEVLNGQLEDFAKEFGASYAWVGHGHSGATSGEILPVAWRRDRFELVAHEFFWLSPTPGVVGSRGWGGTFPRVVTWVRLRERSSGREFIVVNNHWEANNELMEARRESARLLLARAAGVPPAMPIFLVGDFNIVPTREKRNEPYRMLTQGSPPAFADAWLLAAERRGPDTTTNRLHPAPNLQSSERKDWIFVRGPVRLGRVTVDDYFREKLYPSDHLPVILEFCWAEPPS